jgi:hypothetical protein
MSLSALPSVLAGAARALAEAPVDADDGVLLAILGRAVVPALGDVVALYATDASGTYSLIGAAPDEAPPERRPGERSGELVAPLGGDAPGDGLLVVRSTDPERRYDDAHQSAVEVLAAIVTLRQVARRQAGQAAALRQQVESMVLASRELAHLLNNDLTLPVGVVELLMDRSASSPDLQEMLQAASHDLAALERHIRTFHDQLRERSRSMGV